MTLEIIIAIILLFGIFLTAVPAIPGMGMMFFSVLIYAIIENFETFSPWWFLFFGGLMVGGILSDYIFGLLGAKLGGANKKSLIFGLVGLVIGLLIFPPFGLFLGLFLGIFIGEIVQYQHYKDALKAASYGFFGTLTGIAVNVLLAIIFFVSFLILVF